jgi:hypothetical protein
LGLETVVVVDFAEDFAGRGPAGGVGEIGVEGDVEAVLGSVGGAAGVAHEDDVGFEEGIQWMEGPQKESALDCYQATAAGKWG